MSCMICDGKMYLYFCKEFESYDLGRVNYVRCEFCGFVQSKTHFDLSAEQWRKLNDDYHSAYHGTDQASDDSRWVQRLRQQAAVIEHLAALGLIPRDQPWVDYGCGDGKLSDLLENEYSLDLLKYDPYVSAHSYLSSRDLCRSHYDFVVSTSVFEHLLRRRDLDNIAGLVSEKGVMGLHVFVDEEIPRDPRWFYLLPVHCSFYTNRSMQILFDRWNFTSSIYHVESRLWFWFRSDPERVEGIISAVNASQRRNAFLYHFKRGFMDYWK